MGRVNMTRCASPGCDNYTAAARHCLECEDGPRRKVLPAKVIRCCHGHDDCGYLVRGGDLCPDHRTDANHVAVHSVRVQQTHLDDIISAHSTIDHPPATPPGAVQARTEGAAQGGVDASPGLVPHGQKLLEWPHD